MNSGLDFKEIGYRIQQYRTKRKLTQTELAAGNMQKAAGYSEKARLFCWISLGIGLVKLVFIILMIAAILIAGAMPYLILHG